MKAKTRNHFLNHLLHLRSGLIAVVISQVSHGATFYWDTNTSANVQPGNGTWGSDSFWTQNGTTLAPWPGAANVAVFAGSGAIASSSVNTNAGSDATAESIAVALGSNQTAQRAHFNNTGYILQAGSPQSLSITNVGTGIITVASGKSASIGNNATVDFPSVNNTGARISLSTSGTLNINSGGTVTRTGNPMDTGSSTNGTVGFAGTGIVNVAGTLSHAGNANLTVGGVMLATTAGDNITLNINNGGLVSSTSTGNGMILTNNATATATTNLNTGGTLSVHLVKDITGSSTFNFNGGTLQARANNGTFMTGLDAANVKAGGAMVDTNGFDVTIGQILAHDSALGATPDGGLTKIGAGTLSLSAASTYTGPTTVNSGTLAVAGTGSINSSSGVSISGGTYLHTSSVASTAPINLLAGTLDGTGTLGAVTVADDLSAIVTHGNGGTNPLTMGSLTFNGDANVNLNHNGSAPLVVTGALTTTPASGQVAINVSNPLPDGTFNLISFGSLSGGASDFTANFTGISGRQTVGAPFLSGNNIAVNISGSESIVWTGITDEFWETATTGDHSGPNNWALKNSQTATNFWASDAVEFNDTYNLGSGNVAVTQDYVRLDNSVSPVSTTFNNSTVPYVIDSFDTGISAGSLTKNGTATTILSGTHTYTGATTINAGTLQLGDGVIAGLIDGTIANTSSVINNGTLRYYWTNNHTAPYPISGSGSLVKEGGATLTLTGANTSTGSTTITEGAITVTGGGGLGSGTISVAADAALNVNKGMTLSQTTTGSGIITDTSTSQFTISGDFTGFSGTYKHSSGTASTVITNTASTSATTAYEITVGTASSQGILTNIISGDNTFHLGSLSGVANSLVRNGAAVTGNTTLQIGNLNTDTEFAGTIGGGGGTVGLTKVGGGTLTLSGPSAYNGATVVNTGTLAFSTSTQALGSSAFTVANSAGLRVKTAAAGSTLLTTGSLTLGSSNLTFDLSSLNPTVPQISTGALTVNGSVSLSFLNANGLSTGSYKLIDYTTLGGGGSFPGGSFSVGNRATGTIVNNVIDTSIDLNVTSDTPKWTGLDNGNWIVGPTGPNKNWKLAVAGTATDYLEGDTVLFDDSAAGTTSIVINSAVNPLGTTFNNSTKAYTVSGTAGIASGSLTKSGTGTTTLLTTNTYTGATTINAGTLQLGNGTVDGTIANTSGVTNNGTLAYNWAGNHTAPYAISGSGNLTKAGAGTLTVSGNNTYAGGTSITGGVVTIEGAGSLGTGTIAVGAGTTLNINKNLALTNTVTGAGGIVNSGTTAVTGDFSGFAGTFTHNSTVVSVAFNTATATSQNAAYHIASEQGGSQGMLAGGNGDYTLKLGSLSGVANSLFRGGNTVSGITTLEVGNLGGNTEFAGVITNGTTKTIALSKIGAGTLTLSGASGYTGSTIVFAGALNVTGSLSSASVVTVAGGGKLMGTGTVAGTVIAAGTVAPGTSAGTLTTGPATLTGTLAIEIDGATGDKLVSTGTIDVSGATLTVTELPGGFTQASYVIAEGTSINGPFASVPSGYSVNIIAGGAGQQAILTSTAGGGYATWAAANAGGGPANQDFDLDGVDNGVEYFMNATAGFTANPALAGGAVTWPNGGNIPASAYGTQFVVQTSSNLTSWTNVPVGNLTTNTDGPGGSLTYTLPTGQGKVFVRLSVTPN